MAPTLRLLTALFFVLTVCAPSVALRRTTHAAIIAPIDPVLLQRMAANPGQPQPIIVGMHDTVPLAGINLQLAQQALNLLNLNGVGRGVLPLIGGAAGLANAAGITALSLVPGVAVRAPRRGGQRARRRRRADDRVPDRRARRPRLDDGPYWSRSDGRGARLGHPGRSRPDAADESHSRAGQPGRSADHLARSRRAWNARRRNDRWNGRRSNGEIVGVAPEANLVDVRVLDENGNGRMSSVILGIQWVLEHRDAYDIRVINLSLGAPAAPAYRLDPLARRPRWRG